MCILLSLCDSRLGHMIGRQPFAERIGNFYFMESHLLIGNGGIILCKAYINHIQLLIARKPFEVVVTESMGDFSRSVLSLIHIFKETLVP